MSFQCSTELEYKAATNNGLKNIQMAYFENRDSLYTGTECIFEIVFCSFQKEEAEEQTEQSSQNHHTDRLKRLKDKIDKKLI